MAPPGEFPFAGKAWASAWAINCAGPGHIAAACRAAGIPLLHISTDYVYSGDKIGPWQEYKLGAEKYGKWFDPPLKVHDGEFKVPKGPGVGIADPKDLLKGAVVVSS